MRRKSIFASTMLWVLVGFPQTAVALLSVGCGYTSGLSTDGFCQVTQIQPSS